MSGFSFKGNFYTACWCLVEYMQHWHWYKLFGAAQFTLWSIHIEHCTLRPTRCCIALFTLFSNYAIFNHPIDKYFVSNVHSFMYVWNQAKGYYLRRGCCYWKNNLYLNTLICVKKSSKQINLRLAYQTGPPFGGQKYSLTDSITLFDLLSFCPFVFLSFCIAISLF